MSLTKDDMKMLQLLPKMLTTLRKLAAMSQELQQLGAAFGQGPVPAQAQPAHEHSAGAMAPMRQSRISANLLTANPDRFHKVQQDPDRAREMREFLANRRGEAAAFKEQFSHEPETAGDSMPEESAE